MELFDPTLLNQQLKSLVHQAVEQAFGVQNQEIIIEYPNDQAHGDYACNIALRLSKQVGDAPQKIAQKIIENLPKNDLIEKTEIAGPGFINIFLSEKTLHAEIAKVLKEKAKYGTTQIGKKHKIIFEYSSPNIAKPLGVHHLLSTILGQTLYNIFHQLGFNCISINHLGDWGTQFGKLICAYKKWGDKKQIEKDPIAEFLKLYVKFHEEAEKEPALEDEARKEFQIFEQGDKENRQLWQWFVDESLKEIEKTYEKIGGIHFDHIQGESFYEDKMESLLNEGKKAKIFVKGEEDAYIVEYEDPNIPPFIVQKSDGATLYSTRDFAALKYRIETWNPDKIVYAVDIAQTLHFKQLFEAAQRFPWYKDQGFHAWFGRMRMKDAKMSTRKGNVILLNEVLEEAVERAQAIIEEKNPDLKNKEQVANSLGIGAVKYNILSQNRTTEIVFDWDKMLFLEGNSSPYLQYTYARARSILRKSHETEDANKPETAEVTEKTHALIRLFPKYSEQIALSANEYRPNILCNYLYDLAQKFNSFYNSVPVLRAAKKEDREARLQIVEATSQILKNGLNLLGVDVVEEM